MPANRTFIRIAARGTVLALAILMYCSGMKLWPASLCLLALTIGMNRFLAATDGMR